jgi:hypothetical protein
MPRLDTMVNLPSSMICEIELVDKTDYMFYTNCSALSV